MLAQGRIYVAGTVDTKGAELTYVQRLILEQGVPAVLVDLSTGDTSSTGETSGGADVSAREVAACHSGGASAVFTGDRGSAVAAMAEAFLAYILAQSDVAGLIGLGGSGGTALITPAMRALPIGTPKLMVSTVASGNVAPYVGPSDIAMMYSVTDLAGLNRISRVILANAAHAIAGMARGAAAPVRDEKPAIGLSMFGVTTACVNQVVGLLEADYDCLVFHATGTGGQSMEKLADSALLAGVLDVTTTEVCDLLMGGVFPCTADRFGAIARAGLPYVGSCGALDMVNFGAVETVPDQYRGRTFHVHNPQVTLMRTTPEECARIGAWIGERLNRCEGPVRFLLPLGGVSAIDAPGQPFHDPAADAALFGALEATVHQTARRRLLRRAEHVNDPGFAQALVSEFHGVMSDAADRP